MVNQSSIICKTLVVGVIVLFIGVGIQPAFAEVSITTSSNSEDDCDICPKVSNQHIVLIRSLLNRVEKYDNQLLVISKLNPEFEEKYQELSDSITTLTQMNKELNPNTPYNYPPTICYILGEILNIYVALIFTYNGILEFIAVITLFPFVVLFFILCYENPPSNII